jgi:beta-galactosidase beta subunit
MISLEEKKCELGNEAYVNVESYGTYKLDERRYESHIKYVDIQCIIVGRENIVVEPVNLVSVG